ncbi:hypothetical protein Acr_00g0036860 [Actinidia rufa]|uniref:Uncharacterized protein n=1 Tax=Actinidia rufa TaxID=165716 RepID=A0A7J0DGT6_9ERIC|nr:hypothetical protein Acr_00g0036860 [Actinidia rufa]
MNNGGPLGENDTGLSVYYYFATRTLAVKNSLLGANHLPSKKGKTANDLKRKGTMPLPEAKKKVAKSSKVASNGATSENPVVAEKLLEVVIPPLDWEEEQQAAEELKKMREDQDATVEGLEKEVAYLKKKEVLAKKFAIQEYKSSNDFQKEDLEIDDELVQDQEEGEEKESDEKDGEKGDTNPLFP